MVTVSRKVQSAGVDNLKKLRVELQQFAVGGGGGVSLGKSRR